MSQKQIEHYELVDKKDNLIKLGDRRRGMENGLYARSVHIFVFNKNNELFVGRRAANKRRYRSQISSSAGGHVEIGESYYLAAKRELTEELGINAKLKEIGRFDLNTRNEKTIHYLFMAKADKVFPSPGEFSEVWWRPLKYFLKDTKAHPRRYTKGFALALECFIKSQ